jgi:hypothetical protein
MISPLGIQGWKLSIEVTVVHVTFQRKNVSFRPIPHRTFSIFFSRFLPGKNGSWVINLVERKTSRNLHNCWQLVFDIFLQIGSGHSFLFNKKKKKKKTLPTFPPHWLQFIVSIAYPLARNSVILKWMMFFRKAGIKENKNAAKNLVKRAIWHRFALLYTRKGFFFDGWLEKAEIFHAIRYKIRHCQGPLIARREKRTRDVCLMSGSRCSCQIQPAISRIDKRPNDSKVLAQNGV